MTHIIKAAKQVGIIYHITRFPYIPSILIEDRLISGIRYGSDKDFISFSRNSNFGSVKNTLGSGDSGVQIKIDGDKLSENYKIEPFYDDASADKEEREERVFTNHIKNLHKYILGIKLLMDIPKDDTVTLKAITDYCKKYPNTELINKSGKKLKLSKIVPAKKINEILKDYVGFWNGTARLDEDDYLRIYGSRLNFTGTSIKEANNKPHNFRDIICEGIVGVRVLDIIQPYIQFMFWSGNEKKIANALSMQLKEKIPHSIRKQYIIDMEIEDEEYVKENKLPVTPIWKI